MAKREIPLFIIDTARRHKKGECDWIFCTDKDNAFVARIDLIDGDIDDVGDDFRVESRGCGISARMAILRTIGANPSVSAQRTLLKKAMSYYLECTLKKLNINDPSKAECVEFLELLIQSNMHQLEAAGSDYNERKTTLTSMALLQASADYLREDDARDRQLN